MADAFLLVLLILALMAIDVLALEFGADSRIFRNSAWPGYY
jgi:hypothetical protein